MKEGERSHKAAVLSVSYLGICFVTQAHCKGKRGLSEAKTEERGICPSKAAECV